MSKEKKNKKAKDNKNQFVEMETTTANDMVIIVKGEEGRTFRFTMPFHSPLPECYNAAINVANEIARHFNEAVAKQKEKEEKEKADESVDSQEEKKDN